MGKNKYFDKIVEVVKNKASIKQQIYRNTLATFEQFKTIAKKIIDDLELEEKSFDESVELSFSDGGEFEFQIKIGGDIVLFQMHSNVFDFDDNHSIWKTSYVKDDLSRAYCGMINIYNFLADSSKYNRYDDSAYLIGRAFVNKEKHFFLEGKRQLNFIHNDFVNQTIDKMCIENVVQHAILYSMDFDLFAPPFKHVQEISVGQLLHEATGMRQKTGKRLGYKFSFDEE